MSSTWDNRSDSFSHSLSEPRRRSNDKYATYHFVLIGKAAFLYVVGCLIQLAGSL